MNKLQETLKWFRNEDNLNNLRTGSTLAFIAIFVIYFYGFRTGFDINVSDIADIIIDVVIIILTGFIVVNDFSTRGIYTELQEKTGKKDSELNVLIEEHKAITKNVDDDKLHLNLVKYNKLEDKRKMENRKRKLARKWRDKRRNKKLNSRGYKRCTRKVEKYENESTHVRFKNKHYIVDDLLKRGAMPKSDKEIRADYSPKRDAVRSQAGFIIGMALFPPLIRFAFDPSWEAFQEALIFMGWLIPFLTMRAVMAYQASRDNVEFNYPLAIKKQVKIIKWCLNYKDPQIETEIEE